MVKPIVDTALKQGLRIKLLEIALLEYVERYGLTDNARVAFSSPSEVG